MADDAPVLASAVVVPDSSAPASPRDNPQKRRQSSVSESGSKRPRLSIDDTNNDSQDGQHNHDSQQDRRAGRRRSGALEERKRGQRLFGALLGTLSQSQSSAAQRRRADIDKKQQEKLKLQAEEFDQRKKQRLEELMVVRRREQKKYDEQTMRIRHSNLLAMAHFLQTKTEPKLFYKPWELRLEEEDTIKAQVEEAEATIEKELADFEAQKETERDEEQRNGNGVPEQKADEEAPKDEDMVGSEQANEPPRSPPREQNNVTSSGDQVKSIPHSEQQDNGNTAKDHDAKSKEHGDDNGDEVLEAEEDTVIY